MQELFGIDLALIDMTTWVHIHYCLTKYMVLKTDEFLSGGDIMKLRKQRHLASAVCM